MEFLTILDVLLRRKAVFATVFLLFFIIFAAAAALIPPSYQATAKLFIRSSNALSSLMSELDMPGASSVSTEEDIFETKTALAKIKPLLDDLISSLQLKDRKNETLDADDLIKSSLIKKIFPEPYVKIKQDEDTAILQITSNSTHPNQAAAISNNLAELYLDYNIQRARDEFNAVRKFSNNKLALLREDYNNAFSKLTEFKINEQAESLETDVNNAVSRLHNLTVSYEESEQALTLMDKEISQSEQQLRKIKKYRKEKKEFGSNAEAISLRNKLDELLVQISSKSVVYQKEHPEYRQIEKELNTVKKLVETKDDMILNREDFSIDPVYDTLSTQLVDLYINREVELSKNTLLKKRISEYEEKLAKFPEKSADLAKLELALSVHKDLYESFQSYLNKVSLAETIALSDTRIIERAEAPKKKNFPKKVTMYLLGCFLGLFWGTLATFFLEYIDTSISSPRDIQHLDQFPLLGTVPKATRLNAKRLLSRYSSSAEFPEHYRTIRHNLRFTSVHKDIKTLVVTSSGTGEGKSNFAVNLALSYAKTQKKVVLADLNLWRPAVHRYFSLKNKQGIVDIVTGATTIQEAVVATDIPNLNILTVGTVGKQSQDIIESDNLRQILHDLTTYHDVVILDTPALNSTGDALILGTITDYLVYIVECNRTHRADIEHAYTRFQQAGIRQAGCVVNGYRHNRLNNRLLCRNRPFQSGEA